MRLCPICPDYPLRPVPLGGIDYDRCTSCEGMWFDAGKLAAVVPHDALTGMLRAAREDRPECSGCAGTDPGFPCEACGSRRLGCPGCGQTNLVTVRAAEVDVDVCSPCGGFWLDASELDVLGSARGRTKSPRRLEAAGASALALAMPIPSDTASGVIDSIGSMLETAGDGLDLLGSILDVLSMFD